MDLFTIQSQVNIYIYIYLHNYTCKNIILFIVKSNLMFTNTSLYLNLAHLIVKLKL